MFQGLINGFRIPEELTHLENIFCEILHLTEQSFGLRDNSYGITVRYFDYNRGPVTCPDFTTKTLTIWLTQTASQNVVASIYEFAHEIVHCLRPASLKELKYLEEGIASYNEKLIVEHYKHHYEPLNPDEPYEAKLLDAFTDFESLYLLDDGIISRIQAGNNNTLSSITPTQINQNLNGVSVNDNILQRLNRPF